MSTLGSSVINKSGKKFAPKAPVRRTAASTSTQNSARASVDRQNLSQTPQPQLQTQPQPQPQHEAQSQLQLQPHLRNSQHRVANSTITPASQSASLLSQQITLKESTAGSHKDGPVPSSVSVSDIPSNTVSEATDVPPLPHADLQKRTLETTSSRVQEQGQSIVNADINTAPVEPQDTASREIGTEPNSPAILTRSGSTQDTSTATASSRQPNTPLLRKVVGGSDNIAPAPKRRKIEKQPQEILAVPTASHADVNVPLPSTENDGVVVEPPENAKLRSATKQLIKTTQPAKARKPRVSAKEKRKQRVEVLDAEIVTDTARGSSAFKGKGRQDSNKPRKPRRKKPGTQEEQSAENAAAGIVADAIQGSSTKKKSKRHRSRCGTTPEGAEDVRIVPSEVKMSDLCGNFHTGRKSARELELEKIEKAELIQKKQRRLQEVMGEGDTSSQVSESGDQRLERLAREKGDREEASRAVPNTIIVDGQIQIDETTLQLDRHAYAAEERDAEQLEGVDESELTRRVNQGSWAKRDKSGSWNEESTDKFYDGLRMFGTDFEMISKLFPGRTRHSVKLKFCKEEKLDKQKIKQTLMGERIPVDMEEYSKISNTTYSDPRELERELEEDRKRMEAEHAAEKEAMDEIRRQREAVVAAEAAAVGDDSSAKENRDAVQGTAPTSGRKGKKAAKVKKKSGRGKMGDAGSQEGVLVPIDDMARQEAAPAEA